MSEQLDAATEAAHKAIDDLRLAAGIIVVNSMVEHEEPLEESNLVNFAKRELEMIEARIGADDKDDLEMQQMMTKHILHMVSEFSKEGHSGTSASYAITTLKQLLNFNPLLPLTGQDDEWNEVGEGVFQNKRCSRIFKDADGMAYNIEGKVFREPDGSCFTNGASRVYITFPYDVPTEANYVDVLDERGPDGKVIEVPRTVAPTRVYTPKSTEHMVTLGRRHLVGTILMAQALSDMTAQKPKVSRRTIVEKIDAMIDMLYDSFGVSRDELRKIRDGGLRNASAQFDGGEEMLVGSGVVELVTGSRGVAPNVYIVTDPIQLATDSWVELYSDGRIEVATPEGSEVKIVFLEPKNRNIKAV